MQAVFKTKDGNFVNFKQEAVKNNFASEKEGRAIYDKVTFATVHSPGQSKSEITYELEREGQDKKVKQSQYYEQFKEQVEAWKSKHDVTGLGGTPIEQWPVLDVRMVATLKFNNVHTVEALAELSDTGLQAVGMGARDLQTKAKAFLSQAKDTAAAQRLASENERLRDQISGLQKQIQEISAKVDKKK